MAIWVKQFGVLVLCLCAGTGVLYADSRTITWATNPQYPPYDWSSNGEEYDGAAVELLSLVIPPGYRLKPVMVPWKRAQEMAKIGEIDLLVNIRITPERATWLEFSTHPTFPNPIAVFMRADRAIPFKSWDELQSLEGGLALGDTYGNGFDEYLEAHLNTHRVGTMVVNFKKLEAGRIDYFVSGENMGKAWLKVAGLSTKIVALSPPVSNDSIHLGFSKKSPFLHLLPLIDARLARLEADGTSLRLLKKYLDRFTDGSSMVFPD